MLSRFASALNVLVRGEALPDPRDGRGFRLLGPSKPFNFNRRVTRTDQIAAYNGWIASAVNRIATDVREVPFGLQRSTGPGQDEFEILDGERIPDVLLRPGRHMRLRAFMQLSVLHWLLAGEFFWYIITENGIPGGPAVGMQILYPQWVSEPLYNEDARRFDRWRVMIPGDIPREIPMDDVIWAFSPSPRDQWRGASPVEQIAITHDFDMFAKAYGAEILEGGGQPPGILSFQEKVQPKDAKIIKQRWKLDRLDPDNIGVLGNGATYQATGASLKDLEWLDLARMNRDQLLAIYGVPAAKLGLVEDVNRNTSDAMDLTYNRDVVKPILGVLADSINSVLPRLGVADPRITAWFKNPVADDEEFAVEKAGNALDRGAITINEYRRETGRDELQDGERYLIPNTHRIAETLEPTPIVAPVPEPQSRDLTIINAPQPAPALPTLPPKPDPVVIEAEPVRLEEIEFDGLNADGVITVLQRKGFLPDDMPVPERALRQQAAAFENRLDRNVSSLRAELRKLFSAEQRQVVKEIRERKRAPQIRRRSVAYEIGGDDWERVERAETDIPLKVFFTVEFPYEGEIEERLQRDLLDNVFSRQVKSWRLALARARVRAFLDGWQLLAEEVDRELVNFDTVRQEQMERAQREAERTVEQLRQTTRRAVAVGIVAFTTAREAAGLTITNADIADEVARIYDGFKGARTQTIAATESARQINAGKVAHQRQAKRRLGLEFVNVWNAILDDAVRDAHAVAHAQRQPLGEKFNVGGEQLRFPLDPRGRADNTINCRCTLLTRIVEPRESRGDGKRKKRRRR